MKAIQFQKTGGPEVFEYVDVAEPKAGQGQVLVDLQYIGVNYTDISTRTTYNGKFPFIPGVEGAGMVEAAGEGVTDFAPGDKVAFAGASRVYAQKTLAQATRAVKLPPGLDTKMGAAAMLQGMTAHYLTHSTYPVKKGDTILVHAGAGGTGQMIIQIAKMLGATVIATVSTEAKAKIARETGADHVILYTQQDFAEEVKKITAGVGLPVVYDSVGKTTFDKSLECLRPRGYMVQYGSSSGSVPPVTAATLGQSCSGRGQGCCTTRRRGRSCCGAPTTC
jgi:NADPH2:quinone reductase